MTLLIIKIQAEKNEANAIDQIEKCLSRLKDYSIYSEREENEVEYFQYEMIQFPISEVGK